MPVNGTPGLELRRRGGGWSAEGPGFYVWDESRDEVLRVARGLWPGGPEDPGARPAAGPVTRRGWSRAR